MSWNRRLLLFSGMIFASAALLAGLHRLQADNPPVEKPSVAGPSTPPPAAVLPSSSELPAKNSLAVHPPVGVTPPANPSLDARFSVLSPKETPLPRVQEFFWTFQLDLQKGKTQLIARAKNKNITLKVVCDHLELHAPYGKVQAQGNVKIAAENLEAAGDKLTISLHDDDIVLEGQAHVKHKHGEHGVELKGEKLTLRVHGAAPESLRSTGFGSESPRPLNLDVPEPKRVSSPKE